MKINCHEYSFNEVKEALERKGYNIVYVVSHPDKRGNIETNYFALLPGEEPEPRTKMESVALKLFHRKPPLE